MEPFTTKRLFLGQLLLWIRRLWKKLDCQHLLGLMRGATWLKIFQQVFYLYDNGFFSLTYDKIGALIAHCIFFWGGYAKDSFKLAYHKTQTDPHYQVINLLDHLLVRIMNCICRRCKNTRKHRGGGIPSFFFCHFLLVGLLTLSVFRTLWFCRINRRFEGPNNSSLVVIHHCAVTWCFYHGMILVFDGIRLLICQ